MGTQNVGCWVLRRIPFNPLADNVAILVPGFAVDCLHFPLEKWPQVLCEVAQLSAGEVCTTKAVYTITISYLGKPAISLRLCKLHILDTWHLAQQSSGAIYGEPGHVKAVAVKKI